MALHPTVQLIGDISLNGRLCDPQHHAALTRNMGQIAEWLGPCDLRIGNLESPLWGDGTVNELKVPRLSTTADAARVLLPLRLDVALLANNHIYDCGRGGFERTAAFLDQHGIHRLGAGLTPDEARAPLVVDAGGVRFGLLNYVGAETNPNLPADADVHVNMLEEERVLADVRGLVSRCDHVVVLLHWGRFELMRLPSPRQRRLARAIIDAGARIVAGAHVHCLQGYERRGDGHIFYGLGNFVFDPTIAHEGRIIGRWVPDSRRGAVPQVRVGAADDGAVLWKFLTQPADALLLEPDERTSRARDIEARSRPLRASDGQLRRLNTYERIASQLRYQRHSRGLLGMTAMAVQPAKVRRLFTLFR